MSRSRQIVVVGLIALAALVYGVSPIDVIPDFLGPLGFADDLGAFVAAGVGIWKVLSTKRQPPPAAHEAERD